MRAVLTRPFLIVAVMAAGPPITPSTAYAQCIDYGTYLHEVGHVAMPSEEDGLALNPPRPTGLVVVGERAYIADSDSGLQVIDMSNPASPHVLRSISTPGSALDIAWVGDRAYVADGDSGLLIISFETVPHIIEGSVDTPGTARCVTIDGDHAYVADGSSGFQVIDISDPRSPMLVGGVDTPASTWGLDLVGNVAFVACATGLIAIDVTDPTYPSIIGSVNTPDRALGVAVLNAYAYVACDSAGLQVIDVSDPASLQLVATVALPCNGQTCGVSCVTPTQDNAYLCLGGRSGLHLVDLSDPAAPILLLSVGTLGPTTSVRVDGHRAYIRTRGFWSGSGNESNPVFVPGRLTVLHVGDPASPPIVGVVDLPGSARSVCLAGSYAYVATGSAGLQIVEVIDVTSPSVVGAVDTPGTARDVAVAGSHAYVADGGAGLQVIDITNPQNPQIVASVNTPGNGRNVVVVGDYAYLADEDGFKIVDIGTPDSPLVVASLFYGGYGGFGTDIYGVSVMGEYAYLAAESFSPEGSSGELLRFDVSDPTSPQYAGGYWPLPGFIGSAVTAVDGVVYLICTLFQHYPWYPPYPASQLYQGCPMPQDPLTIPGAAQSVAVAGAFLYAANGAYGGLQVIDRTSWRTVGIVAAPAFGVAFADDLVFVASGGDGLKIYPLHCQQPVPVLLSGFAADVQDRHIALSWFSSFEQMHDGFNVYRSRALTTGYGKLNDRLVRGRSPYSYLDSVVEPSTTYFYKLGVVDLDGHEVLYDPISVTTPAWGDRTELSLASPSPFRKETVLRFTLAAPGQARLAVYDVAGRLVRVLMHEELPVGDHDATWDGRDDAGLRVAGGTYFVKLTAGDVSQTRKVVYLGGK